MSKETEQTPLLPDGGAEWNQYLDQWEREVYAPIFAACGISKDCALTCWFVNRLHNAIPDDDVVADVVDEPWRGGQ